MAGDESKKPEIPKSSKGGRFARAGMQAVGGAIPFAGGVFSAAAGAWSEHEQEKVNRVFEQWLQMLQEEISEKEKTILETMARLDMENEEIRSRVESREYQEILKKAFRSWSNIDTESKRKKVRNILTNAAATYIVTDDVIKLFLEWMDSYSDFHFEVIGEIYKNGPIGRGTIWMNLGRSHPREDSAEADLFKLLVRDLSTGGVIRQERATDGRGNFLKKGNRSSSARGSRDPKMKSAFDDSDLYVLTELGKQFVHYAMNEIAPRVEFSENNAGDSGK